MEINKTIAEGSLFEENNIISKELSIDKDFLLYKNKSDVETSIFTLDDNRYWKSYDQILLLGHYLYSVNEDFRNAYITAFGNEFILDKMDDKFSPKFFMRNYFNLFLYGIVVAAYVKNMPDNPLHYLARPIADEPNESLRNYLQKETAKNHKPVTNKLGGPFYCYARKKSMIIPNSMGSNYPSFVMSEIKNFVPQMKIIMEDFNSFTKMVYSKLYETKDPEVIQFLSVFTDKSWSPFLEDN